MTLWLGQKKTDLPTVCYVLALDTAVNQGLTSERREGVMSLEHRRGNQKCLNFTTADAAMSLRRKSAFRPSRQMLRR